MSDQLRNRWALILRLLAQAGFTRRLPLGDDENGAWADPAHFKTHQLDWQGTSYTAVELPLPSASQHDPENHMFLLVRSGFWQRVVQLAQRVARAANGRQDPASLRRQLVASMLQNDTLLDPAVTKAMLQVPRHLFLPHEPLVRAYADSAIITHRNQHGLISSASQPSMIVIMLQQLALQPGMRIMEIGAGTGYNAALLAEITGPSGEVVTIDLDQLIVDEARAHLDRAGYPQVQTICADGAQGYAAKAPYDRIELTVGSYDIAPAWREQLVEGGVLLIPLTLGFSEQSIAFERRGSVLYSRSSYPCGFIRMRGILAPEELYVYSELSGLSCLISEGQAIDPEHVRDLLAQGYRQESYHFPNLNFDDGRQGLAFLLLSISEGWRVAQIAVERPGYERERYVGLYHPWRNELIGFDLSHQQLWAFGSPKPREQLDGLFERFQRLSTGQLRFEAHPAASVKQAPAGAILLRRPFTDLLVAFD